MKWSRVRPLKGAPNFSVLFVFVASEGNGIEPDHGKRTPLIRPVRGFKSMTTAYATIKGFEVVRALRKSQAATFNLTHDIRGEGSLVERAFGQSACALTEAVQLLPEKLDAT